MKVTLFSCGNAANESELKAFEHLKGRLQSTPGDAEWVLLTNLAFSVTHQFQSDEIDILAIGPPGVTVIEVKHWTAQWVDAHSDLVAQEAHRISNKARKIGTTLRKQISDLPRVDGAILLTQEPAKTKRLSGKIVRGIRFFTLNEWNKLLRLNELAILNTHQVVTLGKRLAPKSAVVMDGSLRRLAGYVNLELQTPKEERFHRIYKGSHPARQDRIILHLYDLSADDEKSSETRARRAFETIHRLQLYSWAPRILDSYQEAPGYSGEMFFFTLVDPAAPSIEERASDNSWDITARLAFARSTVRALAELHGTQVNDSPIIHRNLSPKTILVKHDNTPILTGFDLAKIPADASVASVGSPAQGSHKTLAPEIQTQGLGAADDRSDIYALCSSLLILFGGRVEPINEKITVVLKGGIAAQPEDRTSLKDLDISLSQLLGESIPPPPLPPARFWSEDQIIRFRERDYRIVSRLGSGGVGMTFKVVEIDRSTKEELGSYVAKVAHNEEIGKRVLKAYSIVRSHLGRHSGLSAIYEVARESHENDFIAIMTWIEGSPIGEFTGVFPLLVEEQQEESSEALALRWLSAICEALNVLHRNGLIHGDVSPRNMIVSGGDLVLTDYDFVSKIGEPITAPGTILYCSPSCQSRQNASPSDDIYALAASFFHVIFEKEPFQYGSSIGKERGLNWEGVHRDGYPSLTAFLEKATHPDIGKRYASIAEALEDLRAKQPKVTLTKAEIDKLQGTEIAVDTEKTSQIELWEAEVEWLSSLLQSYPGSRWGNRETRGLDTDFAIQTYVETNLEEALLRDIRERRVRLVVLCGNAGDGKTALLQHIAFKLGLGKHPSSKRILEGRLTDGLIVRMNLDGSAAWEGRSADDLLDEFLEPFQQGPPNDDIVHLLAINDGRLLEWIEGVAYRYHLDSTPLTEELYNLLQQEADVRESHIRFISLNRRSLVGGVTADQKQIETDFLDRLVDHLYGGDQAPTLWAPCQQCSAISRCEVFRAMVVFGPDSLIGATNKEFRTCARQRLFESLQAVHLRGETHITVRELRAALIYILFGIHNCQEIHDGSETPSIAYWDRAFSHDSPGRQGEVLCELSRFDPALEAHPMIDRYLMSKPFFDNAKTAPHYDLLPLESARRRAYFEWTSEHIEQVAGDRNTLDLARGQHLRLFRDFPKLDSHEQADLCARLCGGISRLEDLPPQALERTGVVPLRITPRTPTETAFWIEKPINSFRLEADISPATEGVDRLHRQAFLIYKYRDGREERLRLGAELFHILLELCDGYQLGDVSTDDTFAHLSIFVQRLIREDESELLAWNPMEDEVIFKVCTIIERDQNEAVQQISLIVAQGSLL